MVRDQGGVPVPLPPSSFRAHDSMCALLSACTDVSRTNYPEWAVPLLSLLEVGGGATMADVCEMDLNQIYPANKPVEVHGWVHLNPKES